WSLPRSLRPRRPATGTRAGDRGVVDRDAVGPRTVDPRIVSPRTVGPHAAGRCTVRPAVGWAAVTRDADSLSGDSLSADGLSAISQRDGSLNSVGHGSGLNAVSQDWFGRGPGNGGGLAGRAQALGDHARVDTGLQVCHQHRDRLPDQPAPVRTDSADTQA